MEPTEGNGQEMDKATERAIRFRTAGSGVPVDNYALLIKLPCLKEKYGDIHAFLKDSGVKGWYADGELCGLTSKIRDYDNVLDLLKAAGMQCETEPVDFYVLDPEMPLETYHPFHNDHELEVFEDWDFQFYARLRKSSKDKDTGFLLPRRAHDILAFKRRMGDREYDLALFCEILDQLKADVPHEEEQRPHLWGNPHDLQLLYGQYRKYLEKEGAEIMGMWHLIRRWGSDYVWENRRNFVAERKYFAYLRQREISDQSGAE